MTEQEWMEEFADNLKAMMRETGYSSTRLAEEANLSRSTICRYLNESRMPTVKAAINIAYALDCEVGDLIDFFEPIE